MVVCFGLDQQHEERGVSTESDPYLKTDLPVIALGLMNNIRLNQFPSVGGSGCTSYTPGQALISGVHGQYKSDTTRFFK